MDPRKRLHSIIIVFCVVGAMLFGIKAYCDQTVDVMELPSMIKGMDNYHQQMQELGQQMDGMLSDENLRTTLADANSQIEQLEEVLPESRKMQDEDREIAKGAFKKFRRFPYCLACGVDVVRILNAEAVKLCTSIALAINDHRDPNPMARVIADGRLTTDINRLTDHVKALTMMADVEHGKNYSGASPADMQQEMKLKSSDGQ